MTMISQTDYGTDIVREYIVKSVTDRSRALEWIASVTMIKEFDIRTIEMNDFLSYHDGSQTKIIEGFVSAPDFANKYMHSGYTGVSVTGLFMGVSFVLGINIDTMKIALALSARESWTFEKIELILGLN